VRSDLLAGGMAAAALALYAAVALPQQRAARAADAEYRALREEQLEAQSRLSGLERRQARARLLTMAAARAGTGPEAVRQARLSLIRSLQDASLSEVRLSVSANKQWAALLRLSAKGDFEDVVRASGQVVRPGSGLLLERVQMRPKQQEDGLDLALEAALPGATP
jgi:hypothetical protein